MTLCIAWKYEEANRAKICFAADTCVTVGGETMPFGGIKILEVPVVYSTPTATNGHPSRIWKTTYGLAFAGDFLPAFLLKESVADVLTHLQGIIEPNEVSFEMICSLVAKLHQHFHEQMRRTLPCGYELNFFFAGFCPRSQCVRVAKFFVNENGSPLWHEILQGGGVSYETIGIETACSRFRVLLELNLAGPPCRIHFAVLHRLRDVILDPQIDWVDGAIQYGDFHQQGEFRLFGACMLEMSDEQLLLKNYVRGTDLESVHHPTDYNDIYVSYSYLVPFAEEIDAFESASYTADDNRRFPLDEIITVLPYEENWMNHYSSEAEFLKLSFPTAHGIEHIGSTAVPGLPAVPVIDIMIGLNSLWLENQPATRLEVLGYAYVGCDGIPTRRLFRKRTHIGFNVHIVEYGGSFWNSAINLRNYLRNNSVACAGYWQKKLQILNCGAWMLRRYNRKKVEILRDLATKAGSPLS